MKLSYTNEMFLQKSLLEKILKHSNSSYKISDLVRLWLIEIIKRNTVYLNKMIDERPSVESIMWVYLKGSEYMFWWLGVYNMHGFTTQMAQRNTVYTTKIYGKKIIWWHRYIFRKKRSSFFWGRESRKKQDLRYYIMSKERALIQLVIDNAGVLEFENNIYSQFHRWIIDPQKITSLGNKHLSIKNQQILEKFIVKWSRS